VSEPLEDLVDEAKRLADGGVTELTLIAQDTSGYGRDLYGKPSLPRLLDSAGAHRRIHWLRVLYILSGHRSPELIERFYRSDKIDPYLDMPLHTPRTKCSALCAAGEHQAHIREVLDYITAHTPNFMLRHNAHGRLPR
jgi:ribosomal protein S12 methylthiotransferase